MKTHSKQIIILTIVLNVITAMTGIFARTLKLDFKDKLVIEGSSFPEIGINAKFMHVAVTSENQLVISTWEDAFILKNNRNRLIRVGDKKPGDGYYDAVLSMVLGPQDDIYLQDSYSVLSFDKIGKFKKRIPISPHLSRYYPYFHVSHSGDIIAFFSYLRSNFIKLVLEQRSGNGKKVADIHFFNDTSSHIRRNKISNVIYHDYMEDHFIIPLLNDNICFSSNLDYRLFIYNLKTKRKRSVVVPREPEKITGEELKYFKKKHKSHFPALIFPPHRPFFQGMMSDERGRIYVLCTKPVLDADKEGRTLEVFNSRGTFLFRCDIPCMPLHINKGMIFYRKKIKGKSTQLRVLRIMNYEKIPY
jgi:hypothetical protein